MKGLKGLKASSRSDTSGSSPSFESGFTLVELLVSVTVVGILAGIAMLVFNAYERRAHDARAANDIRQLITAEEAYYADNESYLPCADVSCEASLVGVVLSRGVRVNVTTRDDAQYFDVESEHPNGVYVYRYDSETGSLSLISRS